jgi:acyl carrier protein
MRSDDQTEEWLSIFVGRLRQDDRARLQRLLAEVGAPEPYLLAAQDRLTVGMERRRALGRRHRRRPARLLLGSTTDLGGEDAGVDWERYVAGDDWPDAMGREQAVLSHHPAHAARARANPGNAQSRPYFVKVGRFDFPADMIGQISIRTRAGQTGATGDRRRWRSLEKAIHAGARNTPRARDPRQAIRTRRGRRDRLAHRLDLLRAKGLLASITAILADSNSLSMVISPTLDLPPQRQDDIREAFDLDSMDFINLVTAIHEPTKNNIPESDYNKIFVLKNAVAYLRDALARV